MAADISIINQALVALKSRPIQALDEGTDKAVTALTFWDGALEEVLRGHPWNFAVKRVSLNPLDPGPDPSSGYSSAFQKPGDWLRTLDVVGVKDFRNEGKQILCNSATIQLKYIRKIEDMTYWDALAKQALVQNLASKMAYAITESASKEQVHWDKYVAILGQARNVDAQEEPADEIEESSLLTARF